MQRRTIRQALELARRPTAANIPHPIPHPPLARLSGVGAAEAEPVVDLLEDGQQVVDLVGGVGRGQLDAEAGLLAGDHRVRGQGHVDAPVEQVPADRVQVGGVGQGQLDQGEAGDIAGGHPSLSRWSSSSLVRWWSWARRLSPRRRLTSRPSRAVASEATGTGPPYTYEGTITLRYRLSVVGRARKASRDE